MVSAIIKILWVWAVKLRANIDATDEDITAELADRT
jgi:hypothetical protein